MTAPLPKTLAEAFCIERNHQLFCSPEAKQRMIEGSLRGLLNRAEQDYKELAQFPGHSNGLALHKMAVTIQDIKRIIRIVEGQKQ